MMALYRALLCLYPASFRAEYGGEMIALFARQWRQQPGLRSRAALCLRELSSALREAPGLHAEILRHDVKFSLRALRHAPAFSLTVILVAATGIGATTAAFSLADHVLIKPLPFRDPERLVKLWQRPPGGGRLQLSPGHFRDWRDRATSFERVAAFDPHFANLVGAGEPVRLDGARVSGELVALLGVQSLIGRAIEPDDDREEAAGTVMISERLWRTRFAGGSRAIGTIVRLNDQPRIIVGVMPQTFEFPMRAADFWIPFQFGPRDYVYSNPSIEAIARLKPGVSREQAFAEMQQVARSLAAVDRNVANGTTANVIALRDEMSPQSRVLIWCLLAAAAGLLLIACTNLANLLLTRGLTRQKELAVRAALGAGRQRLTRQMVTESVLLAIAGGLAGVAIAASALPMLARLVPTALPIAEAPRLDVRLLGSAMLATLVSAIAFGVVPARRIAKQADAGALREGPRAGSSRRTERLRAMLVIAQVGASVVLLVGCGLLLRAMLQVAATDTGFSVNGVLTLRTALPSPKYDTVAGRHAFYSRVLDDVRALPGVTAAGYTTGLPLVERARVWGVSVRDAPPPRPGEARSASLRFVTPGFFAAMGIPIRAGRDVADADTQDSPQVAVVSDSFANRYWPNQDPIGRRFTVRRIERTIVGVVGHVRVRGLERESEPQMYLPSRQVEDSQLIPYLPKDLVVRSARSIVGSSSGHVAAGLLTSIRAIVARADPEQPISDVQPLADVVSAEVAPRRVQVGVLGAFAAVAFLVAGIGLHGLLAYNVSQRAREIGVRLALGAERRSILFMVMRRGVGLALVGTTTGAAVAAIVSHALQALLADVSPTDGVAFGAAIALAMVMTIAGSLLPALRAVRVDPIEVMRAE
jgi:putative ABC transport system permease protein